MSCYQCSNENLEDVLKIVKSKEGQNAVWNKDDNTIYYNKNAMLNVSLIGKKFDQTLNHNKTIKEIYNTIQLAKQSEHCCHEPTLKPV